MCIRRVSTTTNLLPNLYGPSQNGLSKVTVPESSIKSPSWKTKPILELQKSCGDISNHSSAGESRVNLLQLPILGIIQRRFFSSPIASVGTNPLGTPDFSDTISNPGSSGEAATNKPFTYFVVGATGVLTGMAAKSTAMNFLSTLSASGDVLALAQVEVDLSTIPEGKSVVIKWRGKPVFIRHRTSEEIQEAQSVDVAQLRDPQTDADRTKKPEWIVMMGVCTHLGCVPVADSGDFGGWYCPCQ